jgi:uncharacterized membrane protein
MPAQTRSRLRLAGLVVVFLWFCIGGIAHFAATVLVSGVFELLGAAGLVWPRSRRAAGIGLLCLTVAVTPCHIYMLQRPELFAIPLWALWLRLPIQLALLALIAWTTNACRRGTAPPA